LLVSAAAGQAVHDAHSAIGAIGIRVYPIDMLGLAKYEGAVDAL
jgi:hypothetical protein